MDEAIEELRRFTHGPDIWHANEEVNNQMRVLHVHAQHFEQLEILQKRVEDAQGRLRGLQVAFGGGRQVQALEDLW
ncbi:MAG: hypothetical protein H0W70_01570 [Actinobacteria bacterium]|nr:hypothetical protein [Actinomycetota bacterium]